MNRWKKLGAMLALVGLLQTQVPYTSVNAQDNAATPIEVSVDIMLQVASEPQKRQENATYDIVNDATGEVVYSHVSDAQTTEPLKLPPGKYRLRLYDGQAFERGGKKIAVQKVEMSIPQKTEKDIAEHKQVQEQPEKGTLKAAEGNTPAAYEVPFQVQAGPDLVVPETQMMKTKLAIYLSDGTATGATNAETTPPAGTSESKPADNAQTPSKLRFDVVDQHGQAVEGAVIEMLEQQVTTNAQGQAEMPAVPAGAYPYKLISLPDQYEGTISANVELAANTEKVLTLQVTKREQPQVGQAVVTVVDEANKPQADVTVTVGDKTAKTDAQGQAHFDQVALGDYTVALTPVPEGYQVSESSQTSLHVAADKPAQANLMLVKQKVYSQLSFRVVDESGQPVQGAEVVLADQYRQTTNAEGVVTYTDVTVGPDYRYAVATLPEGYEGQVTGTVQAKADETVTTELHISKKAPVKRKLTVSVVDQTQTPVKQAKVSVNNQEYTTDEQGRFEVTELVPGIYPYAVVSLPETYTGQATGEVTVTAEDDATVTVAVTHTPQAKVQSLTLKVVDQTGAVVPGAEVTIKDQTKTTDNAGQVVFEGLAPGQYEYQVTKLPEHYSGQVTGTAVISEQAPEPITASVQYQQPVEKKPVTVRVLDQDGKEVSGAEVKVNDQTGTTNEYGEVTFYGLPANTDFTYQLTKLPEGYTGLTNGTAFLPGDTDHSITLNVQSPVVAKATATLKVVDQQQKAVADVKVKFGGVEVITDANGVASFNELEPGKYTYGIVSAPNGYTVQTQDKVVDVAAGAAINDTLVVAAQSQVAQLEISVKNVSGQAVPDVEVRLGDKAIRTDANGIAVFKDITPGTYAYYVAAVPEAYQLNDMKVNVILSAGQTLQRVVQLTEKAVAATSSSSSESSAVTATKTSGIERKDGKLPLTGEVFSWLVPIAIGCLAIGGYLVFGKRRKDATSHNEDESTPTE